MNVQQLREALEGLPDDLEVIVSRDEEGNGFRSLYEVERATAQKDGWEYDFVDEADRDEYEASDLIDVLVLWP